MRGDNLKDPKRRALVLAGGGAKGAYAFGCLESIHAAGIRFDAVSGTSVGAINAALWAAEALSDAKALWRDLSFANVYPSRLLDPTRHHRLVIYTCAFAYVAIRLFWAALQGYPVPGAQAWRAIGAVLSTTPILAVLLFDEPTWSSTRQYTITVVVFLVVSLLHWLFLRRGTSHGVMTFVAHSASLVGLMGIGGIVAVLDTRVDIRAWGAWGCLGAIPVIVLGILIAVGWLQLILTLMERLAHKDVSVLGSGPLVQRLTTILEAHPLRLPTIIATAREVEIFDPDNPEWNTSNVRLNGMPYPGATWHPTTTKAWCPVYFRLDNMGAHVGGRLCAASAALPFGIVPPITLNGIDYVDGGVIDNVPIAPFYNDPEIDEVFVVLLQPFASDAEAINASGLREIDWASRVRLQQLSGYPLPASWQWEQREFKDRNDPPSIIPFPQLVHMPKLVLFYPKKSLGTFLSGTLNFNGRYAERIMAVGRHDAEERLRQYFAETTLVPTTEPVLSRV